MIYKINKHFLIEFVQREIKKIKKTKKNLLTMKTEERQKVSDDMRGDFGYDLV